MSKDTQDRASESDVDVKSYLADAYLHPIFHSFEEVDLMEVRVDKNPSPKKEATPTPSELSSPSPLHEEDDEPSHTMQHYEVGQPQASYQYEVDQPHHVYQYELEQTYHYNNYEVESHSNVHRYDDSQPHYHQYYHYWKLGFFV